MKFPKAGLPASPPRWLLAVLLLPAVGCDNLPGKPDPAHKYRVPDTITDFKVLYRQNCAGCHGAKGELGPAPMLNDAKFRAIISQEELVEVISKGRPGTPMPAFAKVEGGTLTKDQVAALAKGIEDWGPRDPSEDWPPYLAKKAGDAENGKALFVMACAKCHGSTEKPGEKGAVTSPAFLALTSDKVLRRTIIIGRADLGMPDCTKIPNLGPAPQLSQNIQDITAYLASQRHGGASK